MAERKESLIVLQKAYLNKIDALDSLSRWPSLRTYIQENGNNYMAHRVREEAKTFDVKWIEELNEGFRHIDNIIAHPRTFIEEKREVVLAALAKRVSSASVTHLASHSQFVHGFDEEGNVIPEKILNISSDDNYQIYENRLVMSLILKLSVFVANRYNYIKDHGETRNSNVLFVHSDFVIDGVNYEVDNRIKLSVPSESEALKRVNDDLIHQIEVLQQRCLFYISCPFMVKMKGAKPIHDPISMTNLLEKNPDYKGALKLWRFINSYTKLGIDYSIIERNVKFDEQYAKEIYAMLMGDVLTLKAHEAEGILIPKREGDLNKVIMPRTLLSIDDITFQDDKFQYTQFPEIKAAYDKLLKEQKRAKGEEKLALTQEEAKARKENREEERRQEIIYARDIKIRGDAWREKSARYEDELAISSNQKFNDFLKSEQIRLDEIEARDKEIREKEAYELARRRALERRAYEDSLMGIEREKVLAEALGDVDIENRAFAGGYSLTPTPELRRSEEMVAPNPVNPLYDDKVFYFNPKGEGLPTVEAPVTYTPSPEAEVTISPKEAPKEEEAPTLEINLPSEQEMDTLPEAELSDETWDLIRYAIALSKEAVKEVKTKKYRKDENLVSISQEESTYSFPMEHPDVRK
jgi:hypothetical protein